MSLILSPSCFAVCDHHLFPRIAIVSRYYLVYQNSRCHIRRFSSSITHLGPPCIFYILPILWVMFSTAFPQGHIYASSSSSSRLLIYLVLSGRSRSLTRNRNFSVFACSVGPWNHVFIPIAYSLHPPYISTRPSSFTLFLSASLSLMSILPFTSVLYPQN